MLRSVFLASLVALAAFTPAPASACSFEMTGLTAGPLGASPWQDVPTIPANAAFYSSDYAVPAETRALMRDVEDDRILSGTRVFYSGAIYGTLYTLDEPMEVGRVYETVAEPAQRFTATEPLEDTLVEPAVTEVRVQDFGSSGCAYSCGEGTTFDLAGLGAPPDGVAFYAVRYADTEAEAQIATHIHAISTGTYFFEGPRTGFAAITAFDAAGRESERVVVPLVNHDDDGGCRTMPRSSGAQLYAWLGLSALLLRRRAQPRSS